MKFFFDFSLHGWIELVELYKTVYIKKILSRILELEFMENCLKNVPENSNFLHRLYGKDVVFFWNKFSCFPLVFLCKMLQIYPTDSAWKTASNEYIWKRLRELNNKKEANFIEKPRHFFPYEINAETSDLHPSVMCTSKSENGHPVFFVLILS